MSSGRWQPPEAAFTLAGRDFGDLHHHHNLQAKPPSPSRRSSAALRCAGMLGAALLVGNLHRAQRPHGRRAGVCSLCPAGTRLDTSALWQGRLCHGGARHSHRAAILRAVASVRTQPQQRGAGNVAAVRWVHAPARHLPPARASRRHQSLLCFPPPESLRLFARASGGSCSGCGGSACAPVSRTHAYVCTRAQVT